MPTSSTAALFARSHKASVAKKHRKGREQVKEVIFDEEARKEFLTGFHKRKLAKTTERKKKAAERLKLERLERRREQRRLLAEQVAQNVIEVERACGAMEDDASDVDAEWHGTGVILDGEQPLQEEEYENEEQLTTVTVVEDFDPQASTDNVLKAPPRPEASTQMRHLPLIPQKDNSTRSGSILKAKPARKSRKIHYETKSARNAERKKQHARRKEKADRAGARKGKTSSVRKKRSK